MYIFIYIDMVHDSTVQPQFAMENVFGLTFQGFYIHINVCTCMCIYAYMYIYIHMYTCMPTHREQSLCDTQYKLYGLMILFGCVMFYIGD